MWFYVVVVPLLTGVLNHHSQDSESQSTNLIANRRMLEI